MNGGHGEAWVGAVALVLVAIIGFLGTWLTVRNARKAAREAQSAMSVLDTRKVDLDEFREVQARNEAALERADRVATRQDERIEHLEQALATEQEARRTAEARADKAETKLDQLAVSLSAHGQWDLLVLVEVRKANADFPEPPPLSLTD